MVWRIKISPSAPDTAFLSTRGNSLMEHILENINKSGLKFLQPLNLSQTYPIIVEEAAKLLQADIGSLYLVEDGELKPVATFPHDSRFIITPRKTGNAYHAYLEKKPIVIRKEDINAIHPELKGEGYKSSIGLPISYYGKSIGALMFFSKQDRKFSEREHGLLKIFGSYASLAIRKAQLLDENKLALETRDLFISMAAHELRTPLTTISGYTQLLENKLAGKNIPEAKWVQELRWETHRLSILVNELLEVNRIKQGKLQYQLKEVSLCEVLRRAIANFLFVHPHRIIEFKDERGNNKDVIIADHDKLLQLFTNILDNAAKFSLKSAPILVIIQTKPQSVIVKIKDKGKGIEKTDMPNLFKQYYQKAQHGEEGMGLGLYLAKNVLSVHHGTIKVQSKIKRGTTVIITLPRSKQT